MAKDTSSLGSKLSFLASMNGSDTMSNPFDDNADVSSSESFRVLEDQLSVASEKKKQKKDKVEALSQKLAKISEKSLIHDDDGEIFDNYIANSFEDDIDENLQNNLLSLGRKYARDTSIDGNMSELSKTFAGSEKRLDELYKEIGRDTENLEKDISMLRNNRTRNFKSLSDLSTAKLEAHNTALGVIKEINNIKKMKYDIQMKMDKGTADASDSSIAAQKAVQQVLGLGGRSSLVEGVGGYEGSSGALSESDETIDESDLDEQILRKHYSDQNETEGDKYLKYEDVDPHYVLLVNKSTGKMQGVITEDRDGNLLEDYPKPEVSEGSLTIDSDSHTATDSCMREYTIREV